MSRNVRGNSVFLILLGILGFLLGNTISYGDTVRPIFSNYWFSSPPASYRDSCNNDAYEYQEMSDSPESIAVKILSNPPEDSSCQWGGVFNAKERISEKPISFPGTSKDWETILREDSSVLPLKYGRSCLNKNGQEVRVIETIINPIYFCPPGSRNSDGEVGCVTNPNLCDADVLGRDLKSKNFSYLGHVGLAVNALDQNYNVLEILNTETPALHFNSFISFAENPRALFWGEVFSPLSKKTITQSEASEIIQEATSVGASNPEYVWAPIAFPGKDVVTYVFNFKTMGFLKQNITIPGFFRCDTFVAYAYEKGAGINLGSYALLTPHKIYNNFTQKRDAFPSPVALSSVSKGSENLADPVSACSTVDCYESQIELLLSVSPLDFDALHRVIQGYIETKGSAEASNLYLYKQAQKYQNDPLKYDFLIQELGQQRPIHLVSDLVQAYEKERAKPTSLRSDDQEKSSDLLYSMVRALLLTDLKQVQDLSPEELESIKKAQALFIKILKTSNDQNEVNLVLSLADNILPEEEVEELVEGVAERFHSSSAVNKRLTQIAARHFFSEENSTLKTMKLEESVPPEALMTAIFFKMSTMDMPTLDPKHKKKLLEYLKNTKPKCLSVVVVPKEQLRSCIKNSLNWIHMNAKVLGLSQPEEKAFLVNQLNQSTNKVVMANLFLSNRAADYRDIDPLLLKKLKQQLESSRSVALQGEISTTSIQGALRNLDILIGSHVSALR